MTDKLAGGDPLEDTRLKGEIFPLIKPFPTSSLQLHEVKRKCAAPLFVQTTLQHGVNGEQCLVNSAISLPFRPSVHNLSMELWQLLRLPVKPGRLLVSVRLCFFLRRPHLCRVRCVMLPESSPRERSRAEKSNHYEKEDDISPPSTVLKITD